LRATGAGDEDHDQGEELRALAVNQGHHGFIKDCVDDPVGVVRGRGQKVVHHVVDHADHGLRVKDRKRQRVKQHDERDKREDRIGRDAEGEGVDLAVEQIGDEGLAVAAPAIPL
jgi:hypothetical protein